MGVNRRVGSMRQLLPQQSVGVVVGAALPAAAWITEVDFYVERFPERRAMVPLVARADTFVPARLSLAPSSSEVRTSHAVPGGRP